MPASIPKKNNLYLDYAASVITSGDHHLISLRFSIQSYIAGMAHPTHHHRVINYDLDAGDVIELNDLFQANVDYLNVISHYVSQVLSRHLSNQAMLTIGIAPQAENFKNWNIKPNGILFTFDEYQVAPYAEGMQTVLVPYAILKPLMSADSPLLNCVRHPKRCRNSNLLTGGFIDTVINLRHRTLNPIFSKK